jgi:GNAT superfamily N-acetyltransferase
VASADIDASPLEAMGFERGWEPCWMATELTALAVCTDDRVSLTADVPEYDPEGQRLLTLAQRRDATAWHAVARVDGVFAGRAWSFATGPHAGVYDLDVWPGFRRRGLGRALLHAVCGAARTAGAQLATLNATTESEPLYAGEGFARLGKGITYWHHLR